MPDDRHTRQGGEPTTYRQPRAGVDVVRPIPSLSDLLAQARRKAGELFRTQPDPGVKPVQSSGRTESTPCACSRAGGVVTASGEGGRGRGRTRSAVGRERMHAAVWAVKVPFFPNPFFHSTKNTC